jgi:DNA-binding GntR family transcriptional regulator
MLKDSLGPMETASLADQAYWRLHDAVQDGSLRPGEKITERDLAARLGISPTPVREALRQLVLERIVERSGPRSLRVADHSATTRREVMEAEVRMSALMARLAVRTATAAQLTELVGLLDRADQLVAGIEESLAQQGFSGPVPERLTEVFQLMREFHHQVEACVHNPVLQGLLRQARAFSDEERLDLTMRLAPDRAASFRSRYHEHRELLNALLDRDEDRAEQLALDHHRAALAELAGL